MEHRTETIQAMNKLSLEQKVALLGGKTMWKTYDFPWQDIPAITFSDGPIGVRRQPGKEDNLGLNESLPCTCFPSLSTLANSWDPKLAELEGQALGEEATALDVDVLLGPGMNIKRNPLCGRNFEYFSEDPYLAGKMAAGYIKGVQRKAGSACVKHFAVNSQETRRMSTNAVVDERALREIYLTGFEIAISEGKPSTLMTSYNSLNGSYTNENEHLIKDILRGEWGYDGLVITDWGGSNDHVAGVAAGSDVEMPYCGFDSARALMAAVEAGDISTDVIDERAMSVLDAAFTLQEIRQKRRKKVLRNEDGDPVVPEEDLEKHHETAQKIAAESIVLLKNDNHILPLSASKNVAVIGEFARKPHNQGAGSASVNAVNTENVMDVLDHYPIQCMTYEQGYQSGKGIDKTLEQNAVAAANKADAVLFFFGLEDGSETEGMDRPNMKIPENQAHLLQTLGELDTPVIGVLCSGSVVEMPWLYCLDALVLAGLGGAAGASAVLDVITGNVNPSGRLSETWPVNYEEVPSGHWFAGAERNEEYRESIYVGYRYFDTANMPVCFPFGYGLSYTEFKYSDLKVTRRGATFTIENVGKRDGAEVAQLYVSLPDSRIFRAKEELKGFTKVFLKAGESAQVRIPLDDKAFRYWNTASKQWETEGGMYQIAVGSGSHDIRLSAELKVTGTVAPIPYEGADLKTYRSGRITQVSDQEYAAILGHEVVKPVITTERQDLVRNDPLCRMKDAKSWIGRFAWWIMEQRTRSGNNDNMMFISTLPFRGLSKMSDKVSMDMVDGILLIMNKHFCSGVRKTVSGYFANKKQDAAFGAMLDKEKPAEEETEDVPDEAVSTKEEGEKA